jgi:hypothetical protein
MGSARSRVVVSTPLKSKEELLTVLTEYKLEHRYLTESSDGWQFTGNYKSSEIIELRALGYQIRYLDAGIQSC